MIVKVKIQRKCSVNRKCIFEKCQSTANSIQRKGSVNSKFNSTEWFNRNNKVVTLSGQNINEKYKNIFIKK